jgi:hypothetical protein
MPERTAGEILTYMGTDAAKWTDEFMRVQVEAGYHGIRSRRPPERSTSEQ